MEENIPKCADLLSSLKLEFDRRFEDFRNYAIVFELFAQPFSVNVETVSEEIQMELIELQSDSRLQNKRRALIGLLQMCSNRTVCKDLPVHVVQVMLALSLMNLNKYK